MESVHKAVLLHEVVESLTKGQVPESRKPSPQAKEESRNCGAERSNRSDTSFAERTRANNSENVWYLDGTLGGAGHALAIANAFKGKVNVIGLDRDEKAIERAYKLFGEKTNSTSANSNGVAKKVILENENYRNIDKVLAKHCIEKVDMILLDLGLSSDEIEKSGRGFSFQKDEPLEMTMGDPAKYPFTAKDIVNGWKEEDIANVIFGYGEERFARRIARAICGYREKKKIETSGELCEIIRTSVPAFYRKGKLHPATRTFQAIRIAVNDELGALKEGLEKGYKHLLQGGKMAVISFHSLEDGIVKNFFREKVKSDKAIITKKPIVAGAQELAENPRSRSAKLRILQKTI